MIVDERIITFINSMDTENSEILETIEQEALAADVPIIRREMQSFLEVLLLMKKPMRVLEVGTAVGFSALLMSDYLPEGGHITTIENYEKRIPIARENFRRAGKEDKITLIEGDATEVLAEMELLILSLWMPRKGNIFIIFRMCCDCFRMEAVLCQTM
jgi:predicted O-methyltransferase YrrM